MSTSTSEVLSFADAVTIIAEQCKASGNPPSHIVCKETIGALSPAGLREAARCGMVSEVNNLLHAERAQTPNKESKPGVRRGYVVYTDSLRIPLMGADGKLKILLEFIHDDCELLRVNAASMKTAWRNRERWAARARVLIEQSRSAQKVEDLPNAQIAELRQLAKVAWS